MGEACEHFLYDKGYGPTNLTLKQYVHDLFPHLEPLPDSRGAATFPVIEPTLLPISGPRDAATMGLPPSRGGGGTMVSPAAPKYTRVITVRPAATVRPAPTLTSAKTQPPPPRTERPAARTVPPGRKATGPVASARTTARSRKAKRQRRRR
jgi:hypothetical protein